MPAIQFYPVEITYKIVNNKAIIYLFGRTANNEQVCVVDNNFEPYFYVKPKDEEDTESLIKKLMGIRAEQRGNIAQATNAEIIDKKLLGKPITLIKTTADLPPNVPALRNAVKALKEVENVYEADIPFVRRYLIDKGITPMTLTEAEGEFVNIKSRVPVLSAEKIKSISEKNIEEPKIIAIDIETYNPTMKIDMKKNPIVMIALYGKDFRKVITWKKFETKNKDIEFAKSEADMLETLNKILREQSPDIITGYFSDSFDWPYIRERADKYKIKLDFGMDNSQIRLDLRSGTAELGGIASLDIYKFIARVVGRKLN